MQMNKVAKRSFERRPRKERMAEIEAAAREVFSKKGYQAAAVQEIAVKAGISEGSIYKFYNGKRDLLHTIIRKWYEQCISDHVGQLSEIMDTRIKLEMLVRQHLGALVENPDLSLLMFSEVRHFDDYRSTELFQINRKYAHILVDALEEGVRRGDVRDDISPAFVRDFIFGGIEHYISSFLAGSEQINVRDISRQIIEMVMGGIETPTANTPQITKTLVERLEVVADRMEKVTSEDG